MTTIDQESLEVPVSIEAGRELVGGVLRRLLAGRMAGSDVPDRMALEAVALEAIEDLVVVIHARDWNEVGAVEIEACRNAWRIEIRVERDTTLNPRESCSMGRRRAWR